MYSLITTFPPSPPGATAPRPHTTTQQNNSSQSPKLALTSLPTLLLNPRSSSLHILAASTLAGDSSLGLDNIEMTLSKIVSGVCTGDHRSEADS